MTWNTSTRRARARRPVSAALVASALAVGALFAAEAHAAVLHLDGGRRLVGRIVARDASTITVRAYGGDVRVPRADIVRIEGDEPAPDMAALVRTHRRSLRPGDVAGALRLADLAKDHRLSDEEGELLRLASTWKPESPDLRYRLREWERTARLLPATAAQVAYVRRDFGGPCEAHRTLHYVIAADGTAAAVERAGDALERTWVRLFELGDALSVELRVPQSALPVHLRSGHSHWTQFMDEVGELFDTEEGLRIGTAPVHAPDGSQHLSECEVVAAARAIEETLSGRRVALEEAVEELKAARAALGNVRAAGDSLQASAAREIADITRRLLDADRAARAALKTELARTEKLLAELPRTHPRPAGVHVPLARGSAWSVVRHESVAGERFVSRLGRLESSVLARFRAGAALGPEELAALDRDLGRILDLAVPQRLSLRDRTKSAAALVRAAADSLAAGDRVVLTRGAARQLALETGLVGHDAPTWIAEGVAALIETGDGQTDVLGRPADAGLLAGVWGERSDEELAELLSGDAFESDFTGARDEAAALLRVLVDRQPEVAGRFLVDVRDGRVEGGDAAAFVRRFGSVGELFANPLPAQE